MSNLNIWNQVKEVPKEAKKEIVGGRMKGMTDINPVWRIKTLTEQFGPCGFGWKYEILDERLENGANGEIAAFVKINLYIKHADLGWSEAIPGTGGNMFVATEKDKLRTSDECFKMALTDAISVACKALGIGASVYWDKDKTKYDEPEQPKQPTPTYKQPEIVGDNIKNIDIISTAQAKRLFAVSQGQHELLKEILQEFGYSSSKDIKKSDYERIVEATQQLVTTALTSFGPESQAQ